MEGSDLQGRGLPPRIRNSALAGRRAERVTWIVAEHRAALALFVSLPQASPESQGTPYRCT